MLIRTLVEGFQTQSMERVTWNGQNKEGGYVSSGLYFCRITALRSEMTKKMVLLKYAQRQERKLKH